MAKYGTADFGEIDIVEILTDLMDVMKENKIVMPHGLTMLARGLTHMEGVLADISPEINMVQIAAARLKGNLLDEGNWKKQMKGTGEKAVPLHAPRRGYSCAGSRFPAGLHEGPDQDQSGPSRLR